MELFISNKKIVRNKRTRTFGYLLEKLFGLYEDYILFVFVVI